MIAKKLELFHNNKVVNWHDHVRKDENNGLDVKELEMFMEISDIVGIDINVVSIPYSVEHHKPEVMENNNNIVAEAMSRYPGRVKGFAFIDPIHGRFSVNEIERCVHELGMIGIKLYNHFHICHEMLDPIIEKCVELDIPILVHAGKPCIFPYSQPNISDSTHFISAAKKHPEAIIIIGHIGGGGDWYWQLKGVAQYPNLFIDISGSVFDDMIIEETVNAIGANRTLFACDGSISASVGKVLGATISQEEKIIMLDNPFFSKYLDRGCV